MLKSTTVLCVLSILLCFNLNYTFPYNRGNSKKNIFHRNYSNYCENTNTWDRTKKMASVTENTLKIIESIVPTTTGSTGSSRLNTNIHRESERNDEDLTHYEQMVIMKKNPYLDLKEWELKLYNRACKIVRASCGEGGAEALARTASICDEGPYVEIINRGLSGFAIPGKLIKSAGLDAVKPKPAARAPDADPSVHNDRARARARADDDNDGFILGDKISKQTVQDDILFNNLVKDIKKFEESKLIMI